MEKKIKEKKGALATEWLITIIIVVFSLTILLIFYYNIWPNYQSIDSDVCKQSVVLRATLPNVVQSYIPLKCKTNKICITSSSGFLGLGRGNCNEFTGEKGVETIKVKSEAEIEKAYANEILNCWLMMGEGKVGLFYSATQRYSLGPGIDPSCVICDRIAFDKETLQKAGLDMSRVNVQQYMATHRVEGKNLTYLEYMASQGGMYSLANKQITIPDVNTKDGKGAIIDASSTQKADASNTNTDFYAESAILFMQVSAPTHTAVFEDTIHDLGLLAGAGFIAAPVTFIKGAIAVFGDPWTYVVLAVAGIYQHSMVAYNQMVTAGYCGDVSVGDSAREGCSVVRTMGYNATEIGQYCGNIEGMP